LIMLDSTPGRAPGPSGEGDYESDSREPAERAKAMPAEMDDEIPF
jgi:hypothetical protein